MAVVRVNGHFYYTESIRKRGRVTSFSYGPVTSEDAAVFRALAADAREESDATNWNELSAATNNPRLDRPRLKNAGHSEIGLIVSIA